MQRNDIEIVERKYTSTGTFSGVEVFRKLRDKDTEGGRTSVSFREKDVQLHRERRGSHHAVL